MKTYHQLLAARSELDAQIKKAIKAEKKDAVIAAKKIIDDFKLTPKEVFAKKKAKAKYRNPETGAEWSGRGIAPVWIRGLDSHSRDLFLIKD